MTKHTEVDEILKDSIGMDFCGNMECSHYNKYLIIKSRILQLMSESEKDSEKLKQRIKQTRAKMEAVKSNNQAYPCYSDVNRAVSNTITIFDNFASSITPPRRGVPKE